MVIYTSNVASGVNVVNFKSNVVSGVNFVNYTVKVICGEAAKNTVNVVNTVS